MTAKTAGRRKIFTLVIVIMCNGILFSQTGGNVLPDSGLKSPDDVVKIVENSINDNKPLDFLQYCPIEDNLKFSDMAMRLKSVSPKYNIDFLTGFNDLRYYKNILQYSQFYTQIKLLIIGESNPELLSQSMPISSKEDSDKIELLFENAIQQKIRIEVDRKLVYNRSSLYEYTDGYLIACKVLLGEKILTDTCSFTVLRIKNKWKITNLSW